MIKLCEAGIVAGLVSFLLFAKYHHSLGSRVIGTECAWSVYARKKDRVELSCGFVCSQVEGNQFRMQIPCSYLFGWVSFYATFAYLA